MGTISNKIEYLAQTKSLLRETIEKAGGSIADVTTSLTGWEGKFDYLNKTKENFRTVLNSHGQSLTNATPFRQYVNALATVLQNLD